MTVPLNLLPPPDVVVSEEFQALRDQALARLQALDPEFVVRATDPAVRLIEIAAYVRLLLGARVNDAARATFLATARGADLDHVAAAANVDRQTGESNDELRRRAQLAWTALSVAGPRDAYRFHALSVGEVADVAATSPMPGQVKIVVVSDAADGTTGQELLDAVAAAVSDEAVRPVTDTVMVEAATVQTVNVTATLQVAGQGPDLSVVDGAAEAAVAAYLGVRAIGRDVYRSALVDACHVPGVDNVNLTVPAADVVVPDASVAVAGAVMLTVERL